MSDLDMEIRKTGIGSSEVAAVCGLNPWTSPHDVYLEKTGQIEPFAGNEATEWGKILEPQILKRYVKRTGREITPNDQTFRHPERSWQLATPDAITVGPKRVVEAKDVGLRMSHDWGDELTDQVPEYYLVQVAWQLSVLEIEVADVAALIDRRLRIYEVPRDKELEEILLTKVYAFWIRNVKAGVPPEMTPTDRTIEYVKRRWSRETKPLRPANDWEMSVARQILGARESAKLYDEIDEKLSLQLRASIGDAEGVAGPDWKATWKVTKDSETTDWEHIALGLKRLASESEWDALMSIHTSRRPGHRRLLLKENRNER